MAAAKDREMLALIDTMASLEDRERLMGLLREALTSPGAMARAVTAYGLLDALADADPDEEAAHALAECIPRELLPPSDPTSSDDSFMRAFYADFAPAQAEAIRRTLRILGEEGEGP